MGSLNKMIRQLIHYIHAFYIPNHIVVYKQKKVYKKLYINADC